MTEHEKEEINIENFNCYYCIFHFSSEANPFSQLFLIFPLSQIFFFTLENLNWQQNLNESTDKTKKKSIYNKQVFNAAINKEKIREKKTAKCAIDMRFLAFVVVIMHYYYCHRFIKFFCRPNILLL